MKQPDITYHEANKTVEVVTDDDVTGEYAEVVTFTYAEWEMWLLAQLQEVRLRMGKSPWIKNGG